MLTFHETNAILTKSVREKRQNIWDHSSAGRASALQAEGHRFEPYWSHRYGWIPEWPKGADCKSVGNAFEGSNPSPSISQHGLCRCGSIGRAADL